MSNYNYSPETGTRVHAFWQAHEDSTEMRQFVAVERPALPGYPSGFRLMVPSDVVSITEGPTTLTLVLQKGPFVVSDPKPEPPKPTVWDFVPDYKVIMARLTVGDLSVLPAFFELQGKVLAAGLTMPAVAAAAGGTGK